MLEFKDFSLYFKDQDEKEIKILDRINLAFKKGTINVITGKSGSGKSTLISLINGIIPEINKANISGDILFEGNSLLDKNISDRSLFISTVFQNPKNQFYAVNSLDEIAFGLENRNISKDGIYKKINHFTKLLQTENLLDRDLMKLSGGEKQLVAITSVSVMDNEIYIFDEPSASLDKESIIRLKSAINQLKNLGKIIIIAEHRLYYLKDILDKLYIIKNKKVIGFDALKINDDIIKENKLRSINLIEKNNLRHKSYEVKNLFDKTYDKNKSLKFLNFKCRYKKRTIFNFNLSLDQGIYFIIGENGVGKSSFIRNVCNLNKKQKGDFFINDDKISFPPAYISLIMQDVNYQLFTESVLSEMQIVEVDERKIDRILKMVELFDKKNSHPQSLSGGEKQRLALGLAFVSSKKIVIMDEPTSGLCYPSMEKLVKIIKKMKKDGKTVIIVSHDYEFISMANENILEFVNDI
ncbi:ABC transporter ATP-binding protein [Anaerococcus sp. AGMB00486]|uniref:ABC transporter ATP-binding protein n=2 Tax=Anaerococcus TaxID=165779 RepID=A0ABX2NA41_9FIRM|nr:MULTISPECIES: ABC transporter ATP-binding protein [Anaerococcus]MDY3006717.1 ABC transporter ATP-binding protein [Anaerococcus porci]MSS77716.1 ABC transporter ATP-binding protein [Anaerococcus porci]NVF11572.1 ABC transporter ATP-binding protein [Anaerococcus faecalis]